MNFSCPKWMRIDVVRMPILPSLVLLILAVNVGRGSGLGIVGSAKVYISIY